MNVSLSVADLIKTVLSGVFSGAVIAAVLGYFFTKWQNSRNMKLRIAEKQIEYFDSENKKNNRWTG